MATFLSDHPSLRQFLLSGATSTGKKVSLGSYGSVEEAAKTYTNFSRDLPESLRMPCPERLRQSASL